MKQASKMYFNSALHHHNPLENNPSACVGTVDPREVLNDPITLTTLQANLRSGYRIRRVLQKIAVLTSQYEEPHR